MEKIDSALPNMLQIAYRRVNLERRRGDLDKACQLYENYISNSKNRTIANNVAVKYARFLCKVKNDIDKAVKVLLKVRLKKRFENFYEMRRLLLLLFGSFNNH